VIILQELLLWRSAKQKCSETAYFFNSALRTKKISVSASGFLPVILFFLHHLSFGQSIWTNPITGTNPNASNPYTTGQTVNANIAVGGIGRGAGATSTNANDRYNASSWNTGAIDLTAYFEFTLTPNAGCEIDFISFVYTGQASGTGPTSFAFRSSLDGFTANVGAPTATGVTINLSAAAYQDVTTAITFRIYAWGASASTGTWSVNDFTFNGAVTCGCSGLVAQPTAEVTADTVSSISCTSALIGWTASVDADNVLVAISTGVVTDDPVDGTAYSASGTFGSGEELLAGDAQYVIYNGTGTSVTVTGLSPGTTYNYAIFGYDGTDPDCEENYLAGGVFGSFTTLVGCSTPQITSLMINSCNGSNEGTDELIVFENGSDPVNIGDMVIDLPNTSWCNSGCGSNLIVNNSTYVTDLNAMAGCALFVYADPIPAGATVIIFTGDPPSTVLDYSSQCGAPGAPFYVMFLDNSSITGNFANTGGTPKTVDITFGPGITDGVSYIPDNAASTDGASVFYDDAGNPAYFTSGGCVYPLAVRLQSFSAKFDGHAVALSWTSFTESNSDYFAIQRSADGVQFENIGFKNAAGNSNQPVSYNFFDEDVPVDPVLYYRLAIVDLNGITIYSELIAVNTAAFRVSYENGNLVACSVIPGDQPRVINVYDLHGSLVVSSFIQSCESLGPVLPGLYIVEIPELGYRWKIACFSGL
jgi:hypothetical protein